MLAPATVYLDSQDFSRFSASHSEYTECVQVRRELIDLKQRGLARFVFSDVHIWEALPSDPTNSAAGMERVRTIAEFCDGNHLPSASTLVEHELRSLTCRYNRAIWPEWYPYFELEQPDRRRISSALVAETAQNRKQRRTLQKVVRTSPDPRTARGMADEILAKYPFLQGSRQIIQSYFARRAEWNAVEGALRSGMKDIVGFSEWLVANWAHGQRFVASLREANQSVQNALFQLFDKMRTLFEQSCVTERGAAMLIKDVYVEQRQRVLESFIDRCGEKILGDGVPRRGCNPVDPSQAPSLLTSLQFIADVAYRSCLPKQPRNPRKHAASDFADALHVLFLPRVDVFRADRFTCDLLRRAPQTGNTRLCLSLTELPTLIKEVNSQSM